MSDQTNAGDAGDFRGSAADKRKDETVMVNADDLSNLVSSAREDPAPPVVPASNPGPEVGKDQSKQVIIIAGVLGVIAVIAVIILLVNLSSG